ncbi:MFS transporter [Solihabitans fulvus]|uniref:MFS transporter n=1 Tax=Solihabitans fulvus TaxID=1892852 RepID=A0A5B2WWN5_9PSEU|nr:MFS transporter [Solihabitans fulvus]KAA2254859.1 MFS transporter [Solihabitans fulvus]
MSGESLWRHRDFRQLWTGDTISQFGTMVGNTAIPLLAVGVLAATPFQMGLLTAAETAAFLLIGLPAGAWVDRMRRRPLMLRADFARAALLLSVPVAWWAGVLGLAQLIAVALLTGVCTVFFDVAYQSYLPSLVGRDQLMDGNAKLQASQTVAQVSAPAVAGGLVQAVGAASAVLATGLGYLSSALFLLRIRAQEPAPERRAARNLRAEIAEGLRFVVGNPLLRAIAACTGSTNFFLSMQQSLLVLFLARDLGLSAGEIGGVFAVSSLGGVAGALTSGWWSRTFGQARVIWLVGLVTLPLGLLIPLAGRGWLVVLAVLGSASAGYGAVVYNVAQVSFRQAICPDRLLGRMNASIRFLVWGTMPLGGLLGGLLGGWIGVRETLWVSAVGTAAAISWVLFSPLRHMRDLPKSTEETAQTAETEEPAAG